MRISELELEECRRRSSLKTIVYGRIAVPFGSTQGFSKRQSPPLICLPIINFLCAPVQKLSATVTLRYLSVEPDVITSGTIHPHLPPNMNSIGGSFEMLLAKMAFWCLLIPSGVYLNGRENPHLLLKHEFRGYLFISC
jgi:hypothetical protein